MNAESSQAAVPDFAAPAAWHKSTWARNALAVLATLGILYAMIYVDVCMRAHESYAEAEKYWRWYEHPDQKKSELTEKFDKDKAALDRKFENKKLSKDDYDRQLEILQFDLNRNLEESSIKYAYVWYKTAYELFSPPESKWVKLSREKAPIAREKWKEELTAKKIPFEEYMLD